MCVECHDFVTHIFLNFFFKFSLSYLCDVFYCTLCVDKVLCNLVYNRYLYTYSCSSSVSSYYRKHFKNCDFIGTQLHDVENFCINFLTLFMRFRSSQSVTHCL